MKNLEKQLNLAASLLGSSKAALDTGGNFSLMMEGVATDNATARQGMMLDRSGWPNLLPSNALPFKLRNT